MEESNKVCAVKGMCVHACMRVCVCVCIVIHIHTYIHMAVVTEQRQRLGSWVASYKRDSKSDIKSDSTCMRKEVEAISISMHPGPGGEYVFVT